ncbi:hypothetical protein [Lysinibacillus parviboronicapiens]|uniref:hypothetical protein n=1 Tax=Lysinibacillus parviboronicapiens TaxID=436516 RepID=UPI000D371815|nr:hypothetical protein [Lysinibacillus parviboronicapiens]
MTEHLSVLEALTKLATDNVADGGKPYSAIILKGGVQIASAVNLSHKIRHQTYQIVSYMQVHSLALCATQQQNG